LKLILARILTNFNSGENKEHPLFCKRKNETYSKTKLISNCFKNRILTKINLDQKKQELFLKSKTSKKSSQNSIFESKLLKHSKDKPLSQNSCFNKSKSKKSNTKDNKKKIPEIELEKPIVINHIKQQSLPLKSFKNKERKLRYFIFFLIILKVIH
jgi:hypothetical protein